MTMAFLQYIKNILKGLPIIGPVLGRLIVNIKKNELWHLKLITQQLENQTAEMLQQLEIHEAQMLQKLGVQVAEMSQRKSMDEHMVEGAIGATHGLAPVFLHSLWRTGSTFVWSRFRMNPAYHCYYEPLHELLINITREECEGIFTAGKTDAMSHPSLENDYFHEFELLKSGGVPFFRKTFPYEDYCLDKDQPNLALKKYILSLILHAGDRRPVLQFCRSPLRARWLRNSFESINIYILRSAREQWESYIQTDEYFLARTFIIAGHNSGHRLMRPLHLVIPIPFYAEEEIFHEAAAYSSFMESLPKHRQYFVFYYIWLMSLIECMAACDLIIDIDLISTDSAARKKVESALSGLDLEVSLEGCNCRQRNTYTLPVDEMERVEAEVRALVLKAQGKEIHGNINKENLEFLSPEHSQLIVSMIEV